MRTPTILAIALLMTLPATAAPIPPLPDQVCGLPLASDVCALLVADDEVENGEVNQYNNNTYVWPANVTVLEGGRVEIINSVVEFLNTSLVSGEPPILHVQDGGEVVIEDSDLESLDSVRITLDQGAIVTVVRNQFENITIIVGADDALIESNLLAGGNPAVVLTDFTGTFRLNDFQQNEVAMNVTGGSPTIEDLTFRQDTLAMEVHGVPGCIIRQITMTDVSDGVLMTWSACTMTNFAFDDRSFPPTTGIEIMDTTGEVEIGPGSISEFGTGIFYCRANVNIHDISFANNGQDIVSCP